MNLLAATRLPTPGLAFGDYPQRAVDGHSAAWHALARSARAAAGRLTGWRHAQLPADVQQAYRTASNGLQGMAALAPAAAQVRARLRREGLTATSTGQALALAALVMQRTRGMTPYDTQVLAAWLMLQGRLVEMATGEGKTVSAALAAAVAGLAGSPVHLLTANEYLVQRDQHSMAPFYAALGLRSAHITATLAGAERHAAWRADVVYTTASQLAFDYLRDHMALGGQRDARLQRAQALTAAAAPEAQLPGLCLCLVDEADSILLDEAVVPLILAAPAGRLDVAAYRRAYELAQGLQRQLHYSLHPAEHRATLTAEGRARIGAAVAGAGGDLYPARRACELVEAALAARLLVRRDREYAVLAGPAGPELQLIDELTGRIASGRQWQGALHPMVQLKEGLPPSPPTCTAAQITYQRFFPRYLHLAGMSGTLLEARHELQQLYGCTSQRVPLARQNRRRWLGQRCYATAADKWQAVVHSVQQHAGSGRPVLVGTDSVADSAHLSALLAAAGVPHQLLNATQDQQEAEQVARAGQAGCVTVATNMAGRGTDIHLDDAARAAGGLHVVCTMRNRSRRIDRQLLGRAARHGDPGSAEVLVALDDRLLRQSLAAPLLRGLRRTVQLLNGPARLLKRPAQQLKRPARLPQNPAAPTAEKAGPGGQKPFKPAAVVADKPVEVHPLFSQPLFALAQRLAERRDRNHRRELRHADAAAADIYGFSGGVE